MIRTALLSAAVLLVSACGGDKGDVFRNGLPNSDTVQLQVPGGVSGQGLTGVSRQELGEGNKADWYVITRRATVNVNGATVAVLKLVEAITDHPPTSVTGNVAVWGPHTPDLSPNTFKMTVTQSGAETFEYVLEARGKSETDADFRAILSGTHTRAVDADGVATERFGNGTFLIDWDEASELPEHDGHVGTAEFTYSRLSPTANASVDVAFRQVKDEATTQRVDADYSYAKTPGQGGSFSFELLKSIDDKPAVEKVQIRSRWVDGGAGRSDVKASGGDLGALEFTVSECWDTNFNSRFVVKSFTDDGEYGDPATDCAFATAEFSKP